ncbi:MAG TPA: laccase [Actinobacteria bacterium]|nr:laccase [Actinomycetota bacterium]
MLALRGCVRQAQRVTTKNSDDDPRVVFTRGSLVVTMLDRRDTHERDVVQHRPTWSGCGVHRMDQVHGDGVRVVTTQTPCEPAGSMPQEWPDADAMVAAHSPVNLQVRTADCVPVVLWDGQSGVVAVVHAGWKGLVAGVVPAALATMADLGATSPNIAAWVGPSICPQCYPVGPQVQDMCAEASPVSRATASDGTAAVDVAAGVIDQLARGGVTDVTHDARCTSEEPELFSYRGGDEVERLRIIASVA